MTFNHAALRELLKRSALSQRDVGTAARVHEVTLSRVANGRLSGVEPSVVLRLARVLQVDPRVLDPQRRTRHRWSEWERRPEQPISINRFALRCFREHAAMTQTELAMWAVVVPGYISHLESGRRTNPTPSLREALADVLDVEIGAIEYPLDTPAS